MRRSGTHGTRVTVLTPDSFMPTGVSQLMTRTLRQLGYHATLRVLPDARWFATLSDTSKHTQISISPWAADYPGASTFLSRPGFGGDLEARMMSWQRGILRSYGTSEEVPR